MSDNFSLNYNTKFSRKGFNQTIYAALVLIAILMTGCAVQTEKIRPRLIETRKPPDIQLGAELILSEKPPMMSSSLIDKEGTAHVLIVDKARQLYHIQILGDKIIGRELLGTIETKQADFIDIVEHPLGKLRILAGDKQYYQASPNLAWQELKGNRCARFVPTDDELFCAFVVKGEEIAAPERTDYTVGWFLLVPIFYWSHEHASKLVLAKETPSGWLVSAVVDPDTPLDANSDFMVGSDNLGNINFLYFTSKGGGAFIIFAYGYSGGVGGTSPEPKLRCGQLSIDRLQSQFSDSKDQPVNDSVTKFQWLPIKGASLIDKPFIKAANKYELKNVYVVLRPLNRNFSVNRSTGEVNGLMWAGQEWVELSLHNGEWSPRLNVIATKGYPVPNYEWFDSDKPLIKIDGKGRHHLLLEHVERESIWTSRKYMNYLLKNNDGWSAPLTLGSSYWYGGVSSLAVDNSGVSFVAWVNENKKFIGRWIKLRSKDIQ
jgi:hypothetical protein